MLVRLILKQDDPKGIVKHISEIISVWQKETLQGEAERLAKECSSFCGLAHMAGPESDSGSLNQQNLIQNRTGREDRRREVEYEVNSHRFSDRKLC